MDTQKPAYTVPVEALDLQKHALQAFKAIPTANAGERGEARALLRVIGACLAEDFPFWTVTPDDVRHAIAEHSAVGVAGVDAVQDALDTLLRVAQRAKWRTYRAADAATLAKCQAHREAAEAKAQQGA